MEGMITRSGYKRVKLASFFITIDRSNFIDVKQANHKKNHTEVCQISEAHVFFMVSVP